MIIKVRWIVHRNQYYMDYKVFRQHCKWCGILTPFRLHGSQMWFYFPMIHIQTFWYFPLVMIKVLQSSVQKMCPELLTFTHQIVSACTQSVSSRESSLHPFQGHTNPPVQRKRGNAHHRALLLSQWWAARTNILPWVTNILHNHIPHNADLIHPSWKWGKSWFYFFNAAITPVFSVEWSFRSRSSTDFVLKKCLFCYQLKTDAPLTIFNGDNYGFFDE